MPRALAMLAGVIAGLTVPIVASAQRGTAKSATTTLQGSAAFVQSSFDLSNSNPSATVVGDNGTEVQLFSIALAPGASLEINLPALSFQALSAADNSLAVAVSIRACVGGTATAQHCMNPHADAKGALLLDVGALLAGTPKGTRLTVFALPTCSMTPPPLAGSYAGRLAVQYLNPVT